MIKVGIIGTGNIAHVHARSLQNIRGCKVTACCDIVPDKAQAFAAQHGIEQAFTEDQAQDLLASGVDAVCNCTPDGVHAPLSLIAIKAGRHVLCEKPLATNYADARKMAQAAARKGVINMVNFSYRNSAAIHRAAQLVQEGAIGQLMHFEASYLQGWLSSRQYNAPSRLWRLSTRHGSQGVLGDIGVHIVDFATYPAGDVKSLQCRLKTFPKVPGDRVGEYVLDANDSAVITLELAEGGLGTIHTTRWATGQKNSLRLRLFGDAGAIEVDLDRSYETLQVCKGRDVAKAQWKTLKARRTPNMWARFIRSIQTGQNDQPDFARGAAVQKLLDACFKSDTTGKAVKV